MSRTPVSKLIGLVRMFSGEYVPSNDVSAAKLKDLFGPLEKLDIARAPMSFSREALPALKRLAQRNGYKIVTSIKALI